jgi:hypothetical protein
MNDLDFLLSVAGKIINRNAVDLKYFPLSNLFDSSFTGWIAKTGL